MDFQIPDSCVSGTISYPTSSDSPLPPYFTTDRGVLPAGCNDIDDFIQREYVQYRYPPCGVIPFCLGFYSAFRNPASGVTFSDAVWAQKSCSSTWTEVVLAFGTLIRIAVLITKDHFPSGPPALLGYIPPFLVAALRRDDLGVCPETLPRESNKDKALVKLRAIFEAITYLEKNINLLTREEEELEMLGYDAVSGTTVNAHLTAIDDPRFHMRMGLMKKWLAGRHALFLQILDDMAWLFEKSKDESHYPYNAGRCVDGLRQRKAVWRGTSDRI